MSFRSATPRIALATSVLARRNAHNHDKGPFTGESVASAYASLPFISTVVAIHGRTTLRKIFHSPSA